MTFRNTMKGFWIFFLTFWLIIIGVNALGMWDYVLRDILWTMHTDPEWYYFMLGCLLIVGIGHSVAAIRRQRNDKG